MLHARRLRQQPSIDLRSRVADRLQTAEIVGLSPSAERFPVGGLQRCAKGLTIPESGGDLGRRAAYVRVPYGPSRGAWLSGFGLATRDRCAGHATCAHAVARRWHAREAPLAGNPDVEP